uniref:BTB domain-containing protein n=1 Tax=Ditylenchus dipsaci TaxID=166011 RepID=A0A915EKE2_9BILA
MVIRFIPCSRIRLAMETIVRLTDINCQPKYNSSTTSHRQKNSSFSCTGLFSGSEVVQSNSNNAATQGSSTNFLLSNSLNSDEDESKMRNSSNLPGGLFTMTIPMEKATAITAGLCLAAATSPPSGPGSTVASMSKSFSGMGCESEYRPAARETEYSYCVPRVDAKTSGSIKLIISNLATLRQKVTTSFHNIANLPWRLAAKTECTKRTSNVKFFSVYIDCNPESESTLWSCDAVVEFRLISQKSSSADFTRQFTNKFSYNSNNWDKVVVEAFITVQKVVGVRKNPVFDFTVNHAFTSDGTLVIDGVRLYICKPYLALYSPVFHAMFYSRFSEREMKEIPVEDVILEEFVEMLNVVYPSHKPVTADNVEFLLELGDKFEIQFVIDECEKFLMRTEDITVVTKLVWADQYCLAKLQDVCIRTFKNTNDVKCLKQLEEYRNLSDTTKAALLEKIIKLLP